MAVSYTHLGDPGAGSGGRQLDGLDGLWQVEPLPEAGGNCPPGAWPAAADAGLPAAGQQVCHPGAAAHLPVQRLSLIHI